MAQLGGIGSAVGWGVGVGGWGGGVGCGLGVGRRLGAAVGWGVAVRSGVVVGSGVAGAAENVGRTLGWPWPVDAGTALACEQALTTTINANGSMRRRVPTASSLKRLGGLQRGQLASLTRRSTKMLHGQGAE